MIRVLQMVAVAILIALPTRLSAQDDASAVTVAAARHLMQRFVASDVRLHLAPHARPSHAPNVSKDTHDSLPHVAIVARDLNIPLVRADYFDRCIRPREAANDCGRDQRIGLLIAGIPRIIGDTATIVVSTYVRAIGTAVRSNRPVMGYGSRRVTLSRAGGVWKVTRVELLSQS